MNVVMLPSVAGGIGHISRTAALARALKRLDPTVHVEYVLDADRLRPFNIDATMRMGFRPRLMPPRTRESRDAVARACLGDADVIVDDVARYLLPLRLAVPRAAWVSIAMHPIGGRDHQGGVDGRARRIIVKAGKPDLEFLLRLLFQLI